MFLKKHISFLLICLMTVTVLSGCRNREDYSSAPVIPGGEDFTHSDDTSVSSDPSPSDASSTDSSSGSQTSSGAVSAVKPEKPASSSTGSHSHTFKVTRAEPTCTKDGYTLYQCVECGKTKIDSHVPKKGHSWGEWKTVTEPTVSSAGKRERSCTVCGEKETEQIAALPLDSAAFGQEVFRLVNEERAKVGLSALAYRSDVQTCADIRAKEITEEFSHTRPDGRECFTVLGDIEHMAAGENIASGQETPQQVMEGWMNSEGHRKNILSGEFTGIAVGVTVKDGVYYWVQLFLG